MIQSTPARKKTPTAQEESQTLARYEEQLASAQRSARLVRSALFEAKASGDTALEAKRQQEAAALAMKIDELTVAIDVTRGTIEVLVAREKEVTRVNASDAIRRASATFKDRMFALADAQKAYASALADVRLEQDTLESIMVQNAVPPDPYEFRAKFIPTLQMSLHLETQGVLGERRTLDTPTQLEQSGRANLKRMAAEYHELIMRRVRNTLGTNHKPPPEAA